MYKIDLTGQRFNMWIVLEFSHKAKYGSFWKCQCDCGNIRIISSGSLKSGNSKCCGCKRKHTKRVIRKELKGYRIDLTGQMFGVWEVIEYNKTKYGYWLCKCKCGNIRSIHSGDLKRKGQSRICDCFKEHKQANTKLYRIWTDIKSRCHDLNNNTYKYHGAKGVKVCDEWLERFDKFRDWAVSNGYKDFTIKRINKNGDYSPENCKIIIKNN